MLYVSLLRGVPSVVFSGSKLEIRKVYKIITGISRYLMEHTNVAGLSDEYCTLTTYKQELKRNSR